MKRLIAAVGLVFCLLAGERGLAQTSSLPLPPGGAELVRATSLLTDVAARPEKFSLVEVHGFIRQGCEALKRIEDSGFLLEKERSLILRGEVSRRQAAELLRADAMRFVKLFVEPEYAFLERAGVPLDARLQFVGFVRDLKREELSVVTPEYASNGLAAFRVELCTIVGLTPPSNPHSLRNFYISKGMLGAVGIVVNASLLAASGMAAAPFSTASLSISIPLVDSALNELMKLR